jgi:threonylcarbamoyladenosine tRNA methylthiotransferase MtaB
VNLTRGENKVKVAFYTLGCKVNQNDSSGLAALFSDKGYQIVPFQKGADIYVINTCSVTGISDRKSAQAIRRAIGLTPGAMVVVTGCYAQTAPQEIAGIPGVNLVVGMADRPKIVELTEKFIASGENLLVVGDMTDAPFWSAQNPDSTGKTRATLKIEEGCNQFCCYCIVPYARGRVRSQPPELVKQDFGRFLEKGFKEIVLTGSHLGSYGKDLSITLFDLLRELVQIPGDFRIRLGSIEPNDLFDSLIHLIATSEKICQYLHIPLQSGSDRILQRMNRGYDTANYAELLTKIRAQNPLMAIGTDVIAGFPGETEVHFEATRNFLIKQGFSRIHVFRFSPRPGTEAAGFSERVPPKTQESRSAIIQQIAARSASEYARCFTGKSVRVLFEEHDHDGWSGLSGEYLRVQVGSGQDLKNSFQPVYVTKTAAGRLFGELQL